jgi:putative ABC transport system permease protein
MTNLLNDLRFGLRTMAKDRAFTLVAIITLAVALGANTAIFSVVNGILLRPLPFGESDRLMKVEGQYRANARLDAVFSYPNLADLRAQSHAFEGFGIYLGNGSFVRERDEAEPVMGTFMTAEGMRILRVKPQLGRIFTDADDQQGSAPTIIIGDALWKRVYNADPHIIGRIAHFGTSGKIRTIIGVMPPGFEFPLGSSRREYWLPLHAEVPPDSLTHRDQVFLQAVARMRNGATLAQARAEAAVISKRLEAQFPAANSDFKFTFEPLQDYLVQDVRPALLLLTAAVFAVLLIGCANVANLLLARAAGRRREIAIRSAIGATRARIVMQLLIESVLLAVVAGACGLLLAAWGVDVLKALAPADVPMLDAVALDTTAVGFALALSVLTGIVFGLAPALTASKPNLNETLKEGTRGSTEGRARNRARNVLVTATVALSLVLLAGAGLLLRSFMHVTGLDPGFNYRDTIYIEVSARQNAYKDAAQQSAFSDRMLAALRAIPGVTSAGGGDTMPLGPDESAFTFNIVGRPPFPIGHEPSSTVTVATTGLFRTLDIPVRLGRDFNEHDDTSSPRVIIINEAFARKWFPNQNPVGQRLLFTDLDTPVQREIIGVVANVKFHDLTEEPPQIVYLTQKQDTVAHLYYAVRAPNAAALGPSLRAAVRQVDREQPVRAVRTMQEQRDKSLGARRFNLVLLGMLSALAVILAAVGIYSVMSYTVTQRTSEIGIRMALGAGTSDVFALIVGNALKIVVIGVTIGVVVALIATRVMASMMFGVGTNDPLTFVGICALIACVALIASWLPARRAARVDPLVAIRYD